ncbi:hypothetical protein OG739_02160 [Streptomyces longwoodensis]|uniref:hypothetical protein n=1 Tax=Streptomyces longwoodensis TaxID=68231 RepID=UPI003246374C
MSATSDQNRSISEVANSIAREEQYADSVGFQSSQSSSSGGSIGVAFFGLGAGGNWSKSSSTGIATSVSRSTGVRSVVAEATQRISARTQQLAAAVAEAVLGRANSAEKIDLTRFWNWKDSPIQITPADIAPLSTASRAQNLDTTAAGMGASQAKFTPLVAMPDRTACRRCRP